ncbi:MAG: nickel-dependent lactate racemase [Leptospirales bacterium]|nr:nickel-dependent lactate racemase [Leptospirales bacterium]
MSRQPAYSALAGVVGEDDREVAISDPGAASRCLLSGERLMDLQLPAAVRMIYPREPMRELRDLPGALRFACLHPEQSAPLPQLLRPGMKLTIAVEDAGAVLPALPRPDWRQSALECVLDFADHAAVEDIHIVFATACNRRMNAKEMRRLCGAAIYERFAPDRLYSHDCLDASLLEALPTDGPGPQLEVSRRAASSDLIIYLSLHAGAQNDLRKSWLFGLCSMRSAALLLEMDRQGVDPLASSAGPRIFQIEAAINSRAFGGGLDFLQRNEDRWSAIDRRKSHALQRSLSRLRSDYTGRLLARMRGARQCAAVFAGDPIRVRRRILRTNQKQYCIRTAGPADILISAAPPISAFHLQGAMNPLLLHYAAAAICSNFYGDQPLLHPGGDLLLCYSGRLDFDGFAFPGYQEFFEEALPELLLSGETALQTPKRLQYSSEAQQAYRTEGALPPGHAMLLWIMGSRGRRLNARVTLVGDAPPEIADALGWQSAATVDQALAQLQANSFEHSIVYLPQPSLCCPQVLPDIAAEKS